MKYLKLILLFCIMLSLLTGCERIEHKFQTGEMVLIKLDNRKGQIVSRYSNDKRYFVRYLKPSIVTNIKIFSDDGPIETKVYDTDVFNEFELEKIK